MAPEGSPARFGRYEWIESLLPPPPARALDIGCGTGALTRRLAARCGEAVGVDLSPAMLAEARARTPAGLGARYVEGDFRDALPAGETFDVVAAVATLHHLPIEEALRAASGRLRPGGQLIVVDLHEGPSLPRPLHALGRRALDTFDALRGTRGGAAGQAAWAAHGEHERLPTKGEIRQAVARVLPGAELRFRLRWRWTLHATVGGRLMRAPGGSARG